MKLLFVDCCISQRGRDSRTRALANAFLDAFERKNPYAEIDTVDLAEMTLSTFTADMLDRRDALAKAGAFDDPMFSLARQFAGADAIVVAAPYWDLSFPAALRTYIEHISANGVAYHYEADGSHGDCRAKRLVYLTTGGDFEHEDSVGVVHWRQLCRLYGIEKFDYVFGGGVDIDPAQTPVLMAAACDLARRLAGEF